MNQQDLLNELGISYNELLQLFDNVNSNNRDFNEIKFRLGPYKVFSKKQFNNFKSCSICLDSFSFGQHHRILECRHSFHKKCIDKWFKTGNNCPICRFIYFD